MLQQDEAGGAYCARAQSCRANDLGDWQAAAGEESIGNFLGMVKRGEVRGGLGNMDGARLTAVKGPKWELMICAHSRAVCASAMVVRFRSRSLLE